MWDLRTSVDGSGPDLRATGNLDLCAGVDGDGYGKRWWASAISLLSMAFPSAVVKAGWNLGIEGDAVNRDCDAFADLAASADASIVAWEDGVAGVLPTAIFGATRVAGLLLSGMVDDGCRLLWSQ